MLNTYNNMGTCSLCQETMELDLLASHLNHCIKAMTSQNTPSDIYLIELSSNDPYRLYVEARGNASLENLNSFLEQNWLECCGIICQSTDSRENILDKKKMFNQIFNAGEQFILEYKASKSSKINGKILSVRKGYLENDVRVVARKVIAEDERCPSCKEIAG